MPESVYFEALVMKLPVVGSKLRDFGSRVLSLEIWDLVLLASSLEIKVDRV